MALTPVRHVRVADPLWDAAKAKAASEFRTVADVITECLRNYTGTLPVKAPVDLSAPVIPDLSDAEVDGFMEAVSEGRSPVVGTSGQGDTAGGHAVGTPGNGKATAVPTTAPRKRKPRAKVTTASELAKPPEEREDAMPVLTSAVQPGRRYNCCKHCKGNHGGHGDPCMNGCR